MTGPRGPSDVFVATVGITTVDSTDQAAPTVMNSISLQPGKYVITAVAWAQSLSSNLAEVRCGIDTGNFASGAGVHSANGDEDMMTSVKVVDIAAASVYRLVCYRFTAAGTIRFLSSTMTALQVETITTQ